MVSGAAFDRCVSCGEIGAALPELPFAGFIQARSLVGRSILQPLLDAKWTPVGSRFFSNEQYRDEFMAPTDATDALFVYYFIRWESALGFAGNLPLFAGNRFWFPWRQK